MSQTLFDLMMSRSIWLVSSVILPLYANLNYYSNMVELMQWNYYSSCCRFSLFHLYQKGISWLLIWWYFYCLKVFWQPMKDAFQAEHYWYPSFGLVLFPAWAISHIFIFTISCQWSCLECLRCSRQFWNFDRLATKPRNQEIFRSWPSYILDLSQFYLEHHEVFHQLFLCEHANCFMYSSCVEPTLL